MNYDAMGAVPAGYAPQVGAVPAGYAPRVGAAYGYPMIPMAHYDIVGRRGALAARVGADADQAEQKGVWHWFQQEGPLKIKRLYWAGGAAAIGLTWLAYSKGWLGGSSRDYDFDF